MKTRVVDIGTTTDDHSVEQSAVERDGMEEGSKVSERIDARILNLLNRVEERLGQENKVIGTVIKTHTEQIKKLTEVVVGHGTASHVAVEGGNYNVVKKSELPAATKSRRRSKKKDTKGEYTLSTRAKCKKHGAAAVKMHKSSIPPLKRKLDFDDDEDDGCRIEIMQQGHGMPFTYGTNMAMYMESADMPLCLDLLFRPPLGMEFIGSELAVAAYIFGNGLSKKEILIPDEHCCGSRGVLHSLLPGEEVVDDVRLVVYVCTLVLNLVASMMTSSDLNEIGKQWWLPTTKYMKKTNELVKIYVPLNKDMHWYLVVIDLLNEELVYLDSAKAESVTERKVWLDQIRYVAFFLENMFRDGNLFEDKETAARPAPRMSDYYFAKPETGQQDPYS
ncbi:hypothetical protein Ahy_B03g065463 [Arachis hypogaea]|uniref:Ubiquitin-like protease family profile domain-containing protein n=1 Tax=Arachis hypogaea TaxID=3818 RepID=A0A445A1V0_ARAHY|nr:hypothetical protein Ahy_B03g065463 [Arachis hypogaea]